MVCGTVGLNFQWLVCGDGQAWWCPHYLDEASAVHRRRVRLLPWVGSGKESQTSLRMHIYVKALCMRKQKHRLNHTGAFANLNRDRHNPSLQRWERNAPNYCCQRNQKMKKIAGDRACAKDCQGVRRSITSRFARLSMNRSSGINFSFNRLFFPPADKFCRWDDFAQGPSPPDARP